MNDYVFYSISTMRVRKSVGNRLINILVKLYPDTFGHIFECMTGRIGCDANFCGLFVRYVDEKVVCVSVIKNGRKLDRIFTIPMYRNKSYATQMLTLLKGISFFQGFTFLSPVDQSVLSLFNKAGWKMFENPSINKDGTIDMLPIPSYYKDVEQIPNWFAPFED